MDPKEMLAAQAAQASEDEPMEGYAPRTISVELSGAAYRGEDGKSPYVDEDGWWWEFDDQAREYKKTDVRSDRGAAELALQYAQQAIDAANKADEATGKANTAAENAQRAVDQVTTNANKILAENAATAKEQIEQAADLANKAGEQLQQFGDDLQQALDEMDQTVQRITDDATGKVDAAAEAAETRVQTAVQEAQTTVQDAVQEAQTSVQVAVKEAQTATEAATAAAGEAEKQSQAAEKAAQEATLAGEKATEAAGKADTSARLADEAAARANEAAAGTGLHKQIAEVLPEPEQMADDVLYLVPAESPGQDDVYDEWMKIDGKPERIGSTAVDLSGYAKKEDLDGLARSEDLNDYATKAELAELPTREDLNDYATKAQLAELPTKDDLESYAKKDDLQGLVSGESLAETLQGYATKEDLANLPSAGGKSLKDAEVVLDFTSVTWDGEQHEPKVKSVTLADVPLTETYDYYVVSEPATQAGTYYIQVVGVVDYSGGVRVPWTIERAEGGVQLSAESLTVKGVMGTVNKTITITRTGDGELSAESLNPEKATASVEGDKLVIVSVQEGEATVTVRAAQGTNHKAAEAQITVQIERATGSISVTPQKLEISGEAGTTATANLEWTGDGQISIGTATCVTIERAEKKLTLKSVSQGSASITITLGETENYTGATCSLGVTVMFGHTWGVKYEGGPSTKWTRTDDAALYEDPVAATPSIQGHSPFASYDPWNTSDQMDGVNHCRKFKKFWVDAGMQGGYPYVRIADYARAGFKPAPAFADRGDSKGEVDYILVGKYACGDDYSSKPGVMPKSSMTCKQAIDGIAALGDGYICWDDALLMTLWFLYIVEYADWDSQAVVGYGCGATSSKANTGATDSLDYPTGTSAATRETYGEVKLYGVEGVWSNVYFWLAGVRTASGDIYVSSNPADYSAMAGGTGGTLVGRVPASTGWMKAVKFSETEGFEWHLLTTETGGSESTYMADYCYLYASSSYVVIFAGGGCNNHDRGGGVLYQYNASTSGTSGSIGAHFYKRP